MTTDKSHISKLAVSINCILLSTVSIGYWRYFGVVPEFPKVINGILIWLAVTLFPFKLIRQAKAEYSKPAYYILTALLVLLVINFFRALSQPGTALQGNKYLSLLANETLFVIFLAPLFSFLVINKRSWRSIKRGYVLYVVFAIVFSFFGHERLMWLNVLLWPALFYYSKRSFKLVSLYCFIFLIYSSFTGERYVLLFAFFSIIALLNNYFRVISNLFKKFFLLIIALPFIIMAYNIYSGTSFFEMINASDSNSEMLKDTRTFLYVELSQDLTNNKAWLFGKGPLGSYYSNTMYEHGKMGLAVDQENRVLIEVYILNLLFKSGIVYLVLFLSILYISIYRSFYLAKNNFIRTIGILLVGFYFTSFIGAMQGLNLLHLTLFLMIGTCCSNKWINYTDEEIKLLLNKI